MVDLGIFGPTEHDLVHFLRILTENLEKHHIRSPQSKTHYVAINTELYQQITKYSSQLKQGAKSPENGIGIGYYIIKNISLNRKIRIFSSLLPNKSEDSPEENPASEFEPDVLLTHTGDFAMICEHQIIIIEPNRDIPAQLAKIPLLNLKSKRYLIFIRNLNSTGPNARSDWSDAIKEQIHHFFRNRNLPNLEIFEYLEDPNPLSPDNLKWIQKFFEFSGENVIIEDKTHNDHIFKILLLHDLGVGSSSFIQRLYNKTFSEEARPTRGIDIQIIHRQRSTQKISLQMHDMSGNRVFHFLIDKFILHTKAFILLYDMTRSESITYVKKVLDMIRNKSPFKTYPVPILLLGTKKDLIAKTFEEGQNGMEWITDYPEIIAHYQISAKTGENTEEALHALIDCLIQHYYIHIPGTIPSQRPLTTLNLERTPIFRLYHKVLNNLPPNLSIGSFQWFQAMTSQLNAIPLVEHSPITQQLSSDSDPISRAFGLYLSPFLVNEWERYIQILLADYMKSSIIERYLILHSIRLYLTMHRELCLGYSFSDSVEKQLNTEKSGVIDPSRHVRSEPRWVRLLRLWFDRFLGKEHSDSSFTIEDEYIIETLKILSLRLFYGSELIQHLLSFLIHYNDDIRFWSMNLLQILDPVHFNGKNINEILLNLPQPLKVQFLPRLMPLIESNNREMLQSGIILLGYLGQTEVCTKLIEAFMRTDIETAQLISTALSVLEPEIYPATTTYPEILTLIPEIQRKSLLSIGEKQIFHADPEMRLIALRILIDLQDSDAINTLIVALSDVKESVRMCAVHGLVKYRAIGAIVPLLDCYVNSSSPVLEQEIIKSIIALDPLRFSNSTDIAMIIRQLLPPEMENLIQRMISRFEKTENELRKISLIRIFANFNDRRILELLIKNMRDQTHRIQHHANQSLQQILERSPHEGIHNPEEINIILQAMEQFAFFTRLDIQNFLQHFSWRDIIKAILYHPIEENNRLRMVLQTQGNPLNLQILYSLREMTYEQIFDHLIAHIPLSDQDRFTYLSYLSLSYPHSYEALMVYYTKNRSKYQESVLHVLDQLLFDLITSFREENLGQNGSNILL
jgi:GTPase SAR1 family protein